MSLIAIIGVYLVQLLTWTGVGNYNNINYGVQTRYFIPLFAFLPLIINLNKENKEIKNFDKYIIVFILGFIGAFFLMIFAIFW